MADNWSSLITAILIIINLTSTTVTSNKSHISKDLQLPVVLSTLSPGVDQCSHIQWFCFNSTTRGYDCNHIYNCLITCTDSGPSLQTGFCATYSEYTGLLSVTDCLYFELKSFNITYTGYIQLPSTLTKFNDSICTPLNRRGIVCNDCVNGFGPSVNSFGYKCVNCNSYGSREGHSGTSPKSPPKLRRSQPRSFAEVTSEASPKSPCSLAWEQG